MHNLLYPSLSVPAGAFLVRAVWSCLIGACMGSYFACAAYRIPRKMALSGPGCHCPGCGARIPWYLNVPAAGFLALRGRAACCGMKMSPRYLWFELACMLLVGVAGALLGVIALYVLFLVSFAVPFALLRRARRRSA